MPQALRLIIPPLTSQWLNIVKNSSLAVFIGYPDLVLVFAGTVLNQTHAAMQVMAVTMAVYLVDFAGAVAGALNLVQRAHRAEGALMSLAYVRAARRAGAAAADAGERAARLDAREPVLVAGSTRR